MAKRTEKKVMEVETVVEVCDRCDVALHGAGWTRLYYMRLSPRQTFVDGAVELCDFCAEWLCHQLPGLNLERQTE